MPVFIPVLAGGVAAVGKQPLNVRDWKNLESRCASPAVAKSGGSQARGQRTVKRFCPWIGPRYGRSNSYAFPGGFNGRVRNPTLAPSLSAQIVPDPSAFAALVEGAAFDQCPEVLLERIAAGPGQLDGVADGHATMLASELDDL